MIDLYDKRTVVIVHGAWTDASSFGGVQVVLSDDDDEVLEFANPPRTRHGDADYHDSVPAERPSSPVFLVGHSYGGAVIGEAAARADNVRELAYVNASVPAEGEGLLDLSENDMNSYIQRNPVEPALATGLSAAEQGEYCTKQRPITLLSLSQPATAHQAWGALPAWYAAGNADGSIPLELQLRMANRTGGEGTQLPADQLSMVIHPRQVAGVVVESAAASVTSSLPACRHRQSSTAMSNARPLTVSAQTGSP